jgi:HEAT repeat protein
MSQRRFLAAAALAGAALMAPRVAHAQLGVPGPGNTAPLAALEQAGPDSLHHSKSDAEIIKDAKRKISDADPRVRVDGLEKLRYVGNSAEVNELLFRGLGDTDVRVRIKAIDVLGARGANDAVPAMTQDLFLRETPAIERLHLVAALGRIGDSRGALPILEYLDQTTATASRGTAVFALGEIGDPRADDKLIQIVQNDKSPMVRRLAQEAIEKIDGELPNHHQQELKIAKQKALQPTDEKLAKLRQLDAEMQKQKY